MTDGRRTLAPFGRRRAELLETRAVGAYTLLRVQDPDGPQPRPGQFFMLAAVEGWGAGDDERPYLPRAFSHARARDGELWFLLEDVGPGTHRLAALRPPAEVWLTGPLGIGFAAACDGRRPLLCGGGIGIAPLLCLRDELGPAATSILGFRDAQHAPAADFFPGAVVTTDDGSVGRSGLVTEPLAAELDADPHAEVFACGPPAMLEAVRALCADREVPAQLALESGMACGYGACFGCVVPTVDGYVRVCVDGPVLEASRLETALAPGA